MFGGVAKRTNHVDEADNNRNSVVGGQTCRTANRYGNARVSPYVNKRRLPEGEPQSVAAETEGERQLRRLLEQQLDTTLSLAQQMQRHRNFQSSSTYETITKGLAGQISSNEYQKLDEKKQKVDDLKDMGLNESEVALKLEKNVSSNYGKEPSILRQQLMAIQDKIDNKNRDLSKVGAPREAKPLTRHEMELERSLKPTCHQSKLLQALTTTRKYPEYSHPSDPNNHLKSMEIQLMERVNNTVKCEKKKRAMAHSRLNQILDEKVATAMDALLLLGSDLIGSPNFGCPTPSNNDILYTKDGRHTAGTNPSVVRRISEMQPLISDEDIINNRLREDQIRGITRFKNYMPGKASRVLYLKNLANTVDEKDLAAIFTRFQKVNTQPLEYRLMKGRMRGQAFITFPDMELAVEALQFVNGFVWKGKPIIIEYSREG